MDASELCARAGQEADELGPEPSGTGAELWREERWGAVVRLDGLPTTTPDCSAKPRTRSPRSGRIKTRPGCLAAATLAEIGD